MSRKAATNRTRKGTPTVTSLIAPWLIAFLCVSAVALTKHRVTLHDLETLKMFDYLALSPSGDMLAYVVDENIWLIDCHLGSIARDLGKGSVPVWSPDGRHLAYYATHSDGSQLFVFHLGSDQFEQVTHLNGGVNPDPSTRINGFYYDPLTFGWSPDSKSLVFASRVARPDRDDSAGKSADTLSDKTGYQGPMVLNATSPSELALKDVFTHGLSRGMDGSTESPTTVSQLFVVDIHEKLVRQLTNDPLVYFNPNWSPDGKSILCASSEGRPLAGFGGGGTNIYLIDVVAGTKTRLTTGTDDKRLPQWSADGRWLGYLGGKHLETQSVFVVPSMGGRPINATSELARSVMEFHWSSRSDSIVVSYQDGVSWAIANVDVGTRHFESVAPGVTAFMWPMSVAASGTLAWSQSDAASRGVVRILPGKDRAPIVLFDLNPQIKEWDLGIQETVRWKNGRGDDLEGILVKPVGYHEGDKYPLVVDCYPETVSGFMGSTMHGNQVLASKGYMVFYPNARAPHVWMNPFKTTAFDFAARGPNGWDTTVDDVISGVDELIRRGLVDPHRMGLFGFSNGGGIVDYLVTRTARFKCAVSVAAVLPDWSRPVLLEAGTSTISSVAGSTLWQDPEGYMKLSAVNYLDKVQTPMLLAVGDDDTHFLLNMIEMYNGLRWLGKDVTFLRYPKQEHGFTGAALEDFWSRTDIFFRETLVSQTNLSQSSR